MWSEAVKEKFNAFNEFVDELSRKILETKTKNIILFKKQNITALN